MDWLNYHHLLYFWTAAREGGVSRAAEKLRLAQPTVSAQIRLLEDRLGDKLFERQGRRLVLTDVGRLVFRYADEIFGIGREMMEALKGRPSGGRPLPLSVGVANAVPKLVVHRLLRPAVSGAHAIQLVCREDSAETLLAELATHALDVVITDLPAPPHVRVKVFSHLLGESDTSFFGAGTLARRLRRGFPRSLNGAPVLLPTPHTALRRALDQWFETEDLHPRVVGEFDDSALMKTFGQAGDATFPAPSAIAGEVVRQYRVSAIGRAKTVRERYYAISAERRLKHPGVLAITTAAKTAVFGMTQ
ncbi:MAG TPA: transcriptional activator NhaR [Vicinamibacterales bacterium]|nr:transcriptional activator NhaR [Vicinamibacterales bacterium]